MSAGLRSANAAPATLDREQAYERLRQAHGSGRIRIILDPKQLNRPGSLVYSTLDIYVPPLVLLTSSITLLFAFGLLEWTIALIFVLLWQIFGAPAVVTWRLKRRTLQALMASLDGFALLWKQGGIMLCLAEWPENYCLAPRGDWQAFVAIYLVDAEPDLRPIATPIA